MRTAVLDLGTNTFHLAMADVSPGKVDFILREQRFVKLAEHGIGRIGDEPFQRGLEVLRGYRAVVNQHKVDRIEVVGTAALRTASNGEEFLRNAAELGFNIRLITGEEEADLIWRGVRAAVHPVGKVLVLDIGGGSVEMIFGHHEKLISKGSFPIGGAVLRKMFHHSDRITTGEIKALKQHLDEAIGSTLQPVEILIGASGTFESLATMLHVPMTVEELFVKSASSEIRLSEFVTLREKLTTSTMSDRLNWPGLIPERADMIVVATLLVDYVLAQTGASKLIVSNYALKEGLMWKLADECV
jgi:exopolyphosphatase/guanosine-5'-triphosphate,3'-diphosphate pyrophosphatase